MKNCKICKKDKPDSDYIVTRGYKHPYCNPCRLEYQKKHNQKLKQMRNQWPKF